MRRSTIQLALLVLAVGCAADTASARAPATVPLDHILELAKPYPNLIVQIRLQLVRANLKREQVTCTSQPAPAGMVHLQGRGIAPYTCQIGKQRLSVSAIATFLDADGRRINSRDPAGAAKTVSVRETGLKWRWS